MRSLRPKEVGPYIPQDWFVDLEARTAFHRPTRSLFSIDIGKHPILDIEADYVRGDQLPPDNLDDLTLLAILAYDAANLRARNSPRSG
jgi:hypothetical protein